MRLLSLTVLVAALAGCGGEDGVAAPAPAPMPSTEPPIDAPPPKPAAAPIVFETCALETGGDDRRAECADVEVPLDWAQPEGRKIKFFVKRLLGRSPGAHRQLWLLEGGPGAAGDGLESLAVEAASHDATLDIYVPDHRGTGRSARLDCATEKLVQPMDYGACAAEAAKEWGAEGLRPFNTTNAARDVGHVIERTRAAGQEVHVFGVSYGTYLAQRYLQLFPNQPTAVTLDSVCQAGLCSYAKIGYWFDQIGKKYMAECAADAFCAGKLGSDPVAQVRAAYAKADAGTCAGLPQIDGATLRRLFSYFIASVQLRVLIPATTFRLLRCDADDVVALKNFQTVLGKMLGGGFHYGPDDGELRSTVLGLNIAFSEMEETPMLSRTQLGALMNDSVFGNVEPTLLDAYDVWPKYPRDEWVGKYPTTKAPVLLMNGTLDPQTPIQFAEQVAPHYKQPAQTFVTFPRAAHGVISQSPTTDVGGRPCGMTVWRQFLATPRAPLDTSCRDRILGHGFEGPSSIAQSFFGQSSLWGPASELAGPREKTPAAAMSSSFAKELRRSMRATRPWALAP